VGRTVPIVTSDERLRPQASEVERLVSDNSLAQTLAGWSPSVDLRDGLALSAEWFAQESNRASYRQGYTI